MRQKVRAGPREPAEERGREGEAPLQEEGQEGYVVTDPIICARCNREILPVSGQARIYILHGGKHYHVECVANQPTVVCDRCGKVIHPGDSRMRASHGVCPACIREHYPEYADEVLEDDGFCAAADAVSGNGNSN